jgi:hypothetical protein
VAIKKKFGRHMSMDLGHTINGKLISTIDLAMKFVMPGNKM